MRSTRPAAGVALLLSLIPGRSAPAPLAAPDLVLADVAIVDGSGAPARPRQVIFIQGGRITAVLPASDPAAAAGMRAATGTGGQVLHGGWVIPGLIDGHVHLGTSTRDPELTERLLRATVMGGVTSVRDMGGDTARVAAAARLGARAPTPRVFSSYLVGGPAGRPLPGRRVFTPGTDPSRVVREAVAAGATGLKLYDDLDSLAVRSLAVAARAAGLRVWGHASIGPSSPAVAVSSGLASLAHADQLVWAADSSGRTGGPDWRERRSQLLSRTVPEDPAIVALLRRMAEAGVALDPTLTVIANAAADSTGTPADRARIRELFQFACRATRLAHRLGVPIVAGTDALGGSTPNLHAELQLLVDSAGLTPLEAIRAATGTAARVLGAADSLGQVAPGMLADLVLLAADPASDIRNTQRIVAVVRGGQLLRPDGPWRTPPLARAPDTVVPPVSERMARITGRLGSAVTLAGDSMGGVTLADRMAHHRVPGVSMAVVDGDSIAWAAAWGTTARTGGTPVTPATRFQAGSISKPVAALVALQLAGSGQVALDADLTDTLQAWGVVPDSARPAVPITLRRLLSHTAGLSVHGFDGYAAGAALPTLPQVLAGVPPANSEPIRLTEVPGEAVTYSGGGYVVVQRWLEQQTGRRFDRLADRLVLGPLGLGRSFFTAPSPRTRDLASGHRRDGAMLPGRWHRYPEMTAASLWSTPTDLARLVLAVQRGARREPGPLPPAAVREFLTPVLADAGLGVFLGGTPVTRFTHSGSTEGYAALMVGGLDRGRGVVVMTNGDGGADLAMELVRAVAREYRWPDLAPATRRIRPVEEARLSAVVGRYQLGPTWVIEVARDSLGLIAGPAGRRPQRLLPASDREFFFTFTADLRIEFVPGAAGGPDDLLWVDGTRMVRGRRLP
ncbi:MAG: serine hydrolase [Gemmatimonadetes bacterium]|nr:serine hydrolase [Gemmatimonadota bacterium]MBK7785444.1 serine hydrolase [Gemmatimonadota bacterium]